MAIQKWGARIDAGYDQVEKARKIAFLFGHWKFMMMIMFSTAWPWLKIQRISKGVSLS